MPCINQHALVSMAQRQIADNPALRSGGDNRNHSLHIVENIAVGKHYPFGISGGAGGINQCDHIVGRNAAFDFLQILRAGIRDTQFNNLIEMFVATQVAEGIDHILQLWHFRYHVLDFPQ